MNVWHNSNRGRYNWANTSEWSIQVTLNTPNGRFSDTFPEDDCPYTDDMLPSEVLDLLEERVNSYWISTSRKEDLEKIAKIREGINQFDIQWLEEKAASHIKEADNLKKRAARLKESLQTEDV